MYSTLITKITTTLESVSNVKDIFTAPKSKLTAYPCVFFKPAGFSNEFETQNENMKIYRFIMVVITEANKRGATVSPEYAFNTILPNTVDAIIAAFDEQWNQGTIDGHRVTVKIDSADAWEMSEEQDGLVAYAPLDLEIRLLTSN